MCIRLTAFQRDYWGVQIQLRCDCRIWGVITKVINMPLVRGTGARVQLYCWSTGESELWRNGPSHSIICNNHPSAAITRNGSTSSHMKDSLYYREFVTLNIYIRDLIIPRADSWMGQRPVISWVGSGWRVSQSRPGEVEERARVGEEKSLLKVRKELCGERAR